MTTLPTDINVTSLLELAASDYDAFASFTGDLMARHVDAKKERNRAEAFVKGSTGPFPGELTNEQVNAILAVEMMRAEAITEQSRVDAQNAAYAAARTPIHVREAEAAGLRAEAMKAETASHKSPEQLAQASQEALAAVIEAMAE